MVSFWLREVYAPCKDDALAAQGFANEGEQPESPDERLARDQRIGLRSETPHRGGDSARKRMQKSFFFADFISKFKECVQNSLKTKGASHSLRGRKS
jgi:hypothetical protein